MSFFKEIASILQYKYKVSKNEKDIIFYAEHEGYYPYFEGLIDQLTTIEKKSVCYITSDIDDPVLTNKADLIHALYLNTLLPFFLAFVRCKVFVMTLTELDKYHLKRSTYPVHYVYIFHSLVSTHMAYKKGSFDNYDSILCTGAYQRKEIRVYEEQEQLKHKQLVKAGYYRLERIYKRYKNYEKKREEVTNKIILVAPSWGDDNILEACGESLISLLLNNNYIVIVRPHPETIRRSPALIDMLIQKFGHNQKCKFELSVSTDDSLLQADALICDCSGIALEYAFGTERPVLFIDVPYKIKNPYYKKLGMEPFELSIRQKIGILVSPDDIISIPSVIETLLNERNTFKREIVKLRKEHVYAFGESTSIVTKYILDLLRQTERSLNNN
ncbi:MAG: CDP-glycerol glycerophosphotransferase family protein [Armatimonadetes bacterium]|nr:CDP-glycerol glycerophosphotransferase family protein [Armatimonadota bacterium]